MPRENTRNAKKDAKISAFFAAFAANSVLFSAFVHSVVQCSFRRNVGGCPTETEPVRWHTRLVRRHTRPVHRHTRLVRGRTWFARGRTSSVCGHTWFGCRHTRRVRAGTCLVSAATCFVQGLHGSSDAQARWFKYICKALYSSDLFITHWIMGPRLWAGKRCRNSVFGSLRLCGKPRSRFGAHFSRFQFFR